MGKQKLIFLPPPFTQTYFSYQNVNADPKLRKNVTDYFFDLIYDLIKNDKRFLKFKNHKKILINRKGYEIIYKILNHFTKKYDLNWYDLRNILLQDTLDYMSLKLSKILKNN